MRDPAEPVPAVTSNDRPDVPATPSEAAARGYRGAADAPETLRAYRADLACYQAWCAQEGRPAAIPAAPEVIGAYLARWRHATAWRRSAAAWPRWPARTERPARGWTPGIRRSARTCAA